MDGIIRPRPYSLVLRDRVYWYTTMCGKKDTMKKQGPYNPYTTPQLSA